MGGKRKLHEPPVQGEIGDGRTSGVDNHFVVETFVNIPGSDTELRHMSLSGVI
jgi:hypothetical protein